MKTIFLLLISASLQAQVYTSLSLATTNKYIGTELQAGYRLNKVFTSVGYVAMLSNTQPALFQARGGLVISDRALLYGGYVRVHKSNDYKNRNYNSWVIGGQYHFLHYDKGTFLISCSYSPKYLTLGIGMSYNLFK
jgi:hypothetical protein